MNKCLALVLIVLSNMACINAYVDSNGIPYRGPIHWATGYSIFDMRSSEERYKKLQEAISKKDYEVIRSILYDTDFISNPQLFNNVLQSDDPVILNIIREKGISIKNFFKTKVIDDAVACGAYKCLKELIEQDRMLDYFVERSLNDFFSKALKLCDDKLMKLIAFYGVRTCPEKFDFMLKDARATLELYTRDADRKQDALLVFEALSSEIVNYLHANNKKMELYQLLEGVIKAHEKNALDVLRKQIGDSAIHSIDNDGNVLLHHATASMNKDAVAWFIEASELRKQANNTGETPEKIAQNNMHWCYEHSFSPDQERLFIANCKQAQIILEIFQQAAFREHQASIQQLKKEIKALHERKMQELAHNQDSQLSQLTEEIERLQEKKQKLEQEYNDMRAQQVQQEEESLEVLSKIEQVYN